MKWHPFFLWLERLKNIQNVFLIRRGLWNQLEEEMPGRKLSFYVDFLKRGRSAFAGLERTEGDALAPCTVCGYPTSSGVCGVCRIRKVVKEGKE